jgi:hypothetical protein
MWMERIEEERDSAPTSSVGDQSICWDTSVFAIGSSPAMPAQLSLLSLEKKRAGVEKSNSPDIVRRTGLLFRDIPCGCAVV